MTTTAINEGNTGQHEIPLLDANDDPIVPELLEYRLMGAYGEITEWTTLPSDTTIIYTTPAENTIGVTGKKRYLTIRITHDGGKQIVSEYAYTLVDLKGID